MAKKVAHLDELILSLGGRKADRLPELSGTWEFEDFSLEIEMTPEHGGKAYALVRARVPLESAGFPDQLFATRERERALRYFIARECAGLAGGSGARKPGTPPPPIQIDRPGREMLETSAVVVGNGFIEIRFSVRLPVERGVISGVKTQKILTGRLPEIVRKSCMFRSLDTEALTLSLETMEDAEALRSMLADRGLVAFVGNGSILSFDRDAMKFRSPPELMVAFDLPNRGTVRGMGIPAGITVIAGGWGSGKSTLLEAVARGVYPHAPGTGRELVVTVHDAVHVCAEEGRSVRGVDLTPFIGAKGHGSGMADFSTDCASAIESQAAGTVEAIEIGTSLLLFDEDSSAAGFMARDAAMETLVPPEDERLVSLAEMLPVLRDGPGISAIVATGSQGEFLASAETVIVLKDHRPKCMTGEAKMASDTHPVGPKRLGSFAMPRNRIMLGHSLEPVSGKMGAARPGGVNYVQYGDEFVDMGRSVQLVSAAQAKGISRGMALLYKLAGGSGSLRDAVHEVLRRVGGVGLDTLSGRNIGDLAGFRAQELAAAVNRLSNLNVK